MNKRERERERKRGERARTRMKERERERETENERKRKYIPWCASVIYNPLYTPIMIASVMDCLASNNDLTKMPELKQTYYDVTDWYG